MMYQVRKPLASHPLMLQGGGTSLEGECPFVSLFDTATGRKTRFWLQQDKETGAPLEILIG